MRCIYITKKKEQCKREASKNNEFCAWHKDSKKDEVPRNPPPPSINYVAPKLCLDLLSKDIIENLNENVLFDDLMIYIDKFRNFIKNNNPNYNYHVDISIIDMVKNTLREYICNTRRIDLVIEYTFSYNGRRLNRPFEYYCCNTITKHSKKFINKFLPYGCTDPPERKSKIKIKEEPIPKPKLKEESTKDIISLIVPFLVGKDIAMFMKIILTPSQELRSLTKKDVMDLYKEFHPDKAGNDPITQKLCTIVSSKICVLKKQISDSGSPVRPMGSLYNDVMSIFQK